MRRKSFRVDPRTGAAVKSLLGIGGVHEM